jgi:cytochrome c-type biogenesis protein CcmH/NrfG
VGSYRVSVGSATARVKTLQEVESVVMEALTSLLAQDPEAVAEGAMMANRAFEVGTVKQALDNHGSWRTSVRVHGEPVSVVVRKRWW